MLARLLLSAVLPLCFASVRAQISTLQLSLADSTQDVLCANFPNKVAINNLPEDATVQFMHKMAFPDSGIFTVVPDETDSIGELAVFDKNNKLIYSKTYHIDRSYFRLQVGNAKYSFTNVEEIMANPALVCAQSLLKGQWRITDYTISTLMNGEYEQKKVTGENLNGVLFDADIRNKIARMQLRDRIFIESIKAYAPDGTVRYLNSIVLSLGYGTPTLKNDTAYKDLRPELRIIVQHISARSGIEEKGFGLLERLQETAATDELVRLTDDKSPTVKNYAFMALVERPDANIYPILLRHLSDTSTINANMFISQTNQQFLIVAYPKSRHCNKLSPAQADNIYMALLFDRTIKMREKNTMLYMYSREYRDEPR